MKKIILTILFILAFCLIAGDVRSTSYRTAEVQPWPMNITEA